MPETEAIARAWYDALERDDMDAAIALCAPDVEIRYPGGPALPYGGTWRGAEGVERWAAAHDEAEEIVDFRVDEIVLAGLRAVALGLFRGRARDTRREWETRFVHVLTVRDGRLNSFEAHFDTAAAVEAHHA